MAVLDMCMGMCVHVHSWSTAPFISGCEVSKQKHKIVFGMDCLGKIPRYLARENTHRETQRERERGREK